MVYLMLVLDKQNNKHNYKNQKLYINNLRINMQLNQIALLISSAFSNVPSDMMLSIK
jgi:hypothetical protein